MTAEQSRLVEDNIGLVGKSIQLNFKKCIGDEDIYQVGCLGLIKAALTYTRHDIAFNTYAMHSIRNTIINYFNDSTRDKRKANLNAKSIYEKVNGTQDVKLYETITDDIDFSNHLVIDISLKAAFNQLDDMNKEILKLYLQGYSFREMSNQINITHQGISSRFNRKIKPLLKEVVA